MPAESLSISFISSTGRNEKSAESNRGILGGVGGRGVDGGGVTGARGPLYVDLTLGVDFGVLMVVGLMIDDADRDRRCELPRATPGAVAVEVAAGEIVPS